MTETSKTLRQVKRWARLGLLCWMGLALASPSTAEMCTLDVVPSATLLAPYFEVDLNSNTGLTTLVTIQNAESNPALTHITLWTDWGQPTLDFDVFLTGYDVVTFNMRDVFNGNIPITADQQSDAGDSISPNGGNPSWDGSFTDCNNFFPFFFNPVISGSNLERIVNGHTGNDVSGNGCIGSSFGDSVARGYLTIDSAVRCSIEFPSDSGYFASVARHENQLFGDFMLVDPGSNMAVGAPLVHIEADQTFTGGQAGYTFYGNFNRQVQSNADFREPLGSVWGFNYAVGANAGTDLIVWRDPTSSDQRTFYTCGSEGGPEWYPLKTAPFQCLNEQEDIAATCTDGDCLPLATQRVPFGSGSLAVPYDSGWCRLDLATADGGTFDVDFPDSTSSLAQSWVGSLHSLNGLFSGGLSAVQLRSACSAAIPLGFGPVFADGFESGDLTLWASSLP